MSRRSSPALILLLVLALVWAQLAGLVHGVGHGLSGERVAGLFQVTQAGSDGERSGDKGSGQTTHACPDCLAYSALGAALASSHVPPVATPVQEAFLLLPAADFTAPRLTAYRSRAPPRLS